MYTRPPTGGLDLEHSHTQRVERTVPQQQRSTNIPAHRARQCTWRGEAHTSTAICRVRDACMCREPTYKPGVPTSLHTARLSVTALPGTGRTWHHVMIDDAISAFSALHLALNLRRWPLRNQRHTPCFNCVARGVHLLPCCPYRHRGEGWCCETQRSRRIGWHHGSHGAGVLGQATSLWMSSGVAAWRRWWRWWRRGLLGTTTSQLGDRAATLDRAAIHCETTVVLGIWLGVATAVSLPTAGRASRWESRWRLRPCGAVGSG